MAQNDKKLFVLPGAPLLIPPENGLCTAVHVTHPSQPLPTKDPR